ncbi:hypothetical protein AVO45_17910 [Ruegeria marisrubri]|uniref:HTH luxR-type domain-containing protein n=1 Tax=Ruegeria marisrubri TaxID=1685379 RepID=A0A0X3UAK4_9RHOB|nr:hypothetical protein AVO45_17910 [Ruegeria marisrubri]
MISRVRLNKSTSRVAARADLQPDRRKRPLTKSYAADAIGALESRPKLASVFSLVHDSDGRYEPASPVSDWISHRRLSDVIFICLDNQGSEIDFLELHFGQGASIGWQTGIETIAPELSRIFRERRAGLITEALSRQTVVPMAKQVIDSPILGPDNPAGLTRSEWRVCLLVSRGLSVKAICEELEIGRATVRTHLKHIYSKTSLENFHMLARRLVSVDEREALQGRLRQASA